ncbi:hypothetical protein IB276_31560 [Ensifer sp. ENS04]|uniref:hypothetical protein n=1 Tax=Ensifer sp. ENS04 TaxID=2769281 RepID=UPI001781AC6D|nr:hypothetical protein [Ensifer sp. ENS04]MBD9543994.1 hypothetical protein [Ensifer sp. ENS04]
MRAIRVISALVVVGGIAGEAMVEDGVRPSAAGPTPKGRIVSGAFEMDFTKIP